MKGTVTPRPAKYVLRRGKLMPAPLRPYEEWTDPKTGKTVRAGANGSTWTWKFTTGSAKAGTRRHDSKGGFATKAACEASLAEALSAVAKGDTRPLMKPDAIAIGDYLRNWLDARGDLKPSTRSGYSDAVAHWIAPRHENGRYVPAPRLGEVLLSDLRPEQLTEFFGALRSHGGQITKGERETAEAEGRKPVGRPLGPRRVRLAYTIVHMALADAVETGKLPFNPVERVPRRQRPSHNPAKQADQHWSPLQAGIFLADRRTDRLEVLWRFAIGTGARRGEILGLHWSDVDLARAKVTIRTSRVLLGGTVLEGTTKSSRLRVVDLGPRAVDALRMWKKLQGKERERAGSSWLGGDPGETATCSPTR